jgi:hypothetical protein
VALVGQCVGVLKRSTDRATCLAHVQPEGRIEVFGSRTLLMS